MNNQGFSLVEIVVACLLFSVTVLGLFNMQRFFYQQFLIVQQQQQRLSVAQQILTGYPQPLPFGNDAFIVSFQPAGESGCQIVTVQFEQQALSRWYCSLK